MILTETTGSVEDVAGRAAAGGVRVPVLVKRIAFQLGFALLLLALWAAGVRLFDPPRYLLPSPDAVWRAAWDDRENLWQATVPTLQETIGGILLAVVVASVVAILLDFVPFVRQPVLGALVAAQAVPIVAIAPLMVIWLGFGLVPKLILVTVATFFPITVAAVQGLNSADIEAGRLLRSMGASRWQIFLSLRLPSSLPFVVTGLRVVTSYAVTAAVFAEYVGSERGLGIYLQTNVSILRTDRVFAMVGVVVLFSLLLYSLTYLVEALLIPWERRRKAAER